MECGELQKWLKALESSEISLVFPTSFLNNPASAFGHTLLRLHTERSKDTPLISYAINFSAKTGNDGALPYAVKGVFGGYQGYFDVAPYYERLRLYSESENRDIWEFPLSLNEQEIYSLLLHLWELRSIGFTYYYFDDNCSAILLELLESARPGVGLRDEEKSWMIPLDTIQRLEQVSFFSESNSAIFRASPLRTFRNRLIHLSSEERKVLKQVLSKDNPSKRQQTSAKVLDAAIDYISYRMFAKHEEEEWKDHQFQLLRERSKLSTPKEKLDIDTPSNPLDAHKSSRFSVGAGYLHSRSYTNLGFRGAYHEKLDYGTGHSDESEIEFLSTDLRLFDDGDVILQSLDLLHIRSLPLHGEFIRPFSWGLDIAYEQTPTSSPTYGSVQLGFTKPLFKTGRIWLHTGGRNELESGEYRIGSHNELGIFVPVNNSLRTELTYNYRRLYGENAMNDHEVNIGLNYSINPNTAIRLNQQYRNREDQDWLDTNLSALFYF